MSLKLTLLLVLFFFILDNSYSQSKHKKEINDLNDIVIELYYQGHYESAIPYAQKIVDLTKSKKDTSYAEALANLAIMFVEVGHYEEAEELYYEALDIQQKTRGDIHPEIASLLNDLAMLYDMIGDYNKAEKTYKKVLRIDRQTLGTNHPDVALTINNLALVYNELSRFLESEKLYFQALEIQKKVHGEEHPEIALALGNLGLLYKNWGRYDQAEQLLLECLNMEKALLGENHPEVAQSLGNLASLYQVTSQINKSKTLYLESLNIIEKVPGDNLLDKARVLNNLAGLDKESKNYSSAEKNFKASLAISIEVFGEEHPYIAITMGHIGLIYQHQKKYILAEELLTKSYKMLMSIFGEQNPDVSNALSNLASFYAKTGQKVTAENYYKRAINIKRSMFGLKNPEVAKVLYALAVFYNKEGRYKEATSILKEALISNTITAIDTSNLDKSIQEIVKKNYFNDFYIANNILIQLSLSQNGFYLLNQDIKHLESSYSILQNLSTHLQQSNLELTNTKDKLELLKLANECANSGIETARRLYKKTKDKNYLKACISFAEHNKSTILSGVLQGEHALSFGNVPDSLIAQEHAKKEALNQLKKELIEASNIGDSIATSKLKSLLISTILDQNAFRKKLEKNYPKYSKLKYRHDKITTESIQENLLDQSTALLEYFMYDSLTYIIAITKKEVELYQTYISPSTIKQLRQGLSNYSFISKHPKKAFAIYASSAFLLYQQLIAPLEKQLEGIDQLILIPDNILGYIPFEALLTARKNQSLDQEYQNLPYLLRRYKINYSYSAALLLENKKSAKKENNGRLLAFAASYQLGSTSALVTRSAQQHALRKVLGPLPAVQEEVAALEKLFPKGSYYTKKNASEVNFKKEASQYAILHLAMHGILNPTHPLLSSLAFTENGDSLEDNFLEAHEISNLQLHNELVVLSACETGYGKFEQGEGIMSLARSFMYAGVPSLVVSLWQVSDNSTAVIMEQFYQNLASGYKKDEALRQAKLSYIDNVEGLGAHPAFWSPFIQLGDTSPVGLKTNISKWYIGLGIGFLLLLVFGFLFRRREA
jgi:CHAT domain-containing protein/Tfp pilus assembly protein PilF